MGVHPGEVRDPDPGPQKWYHGRTKWSGLLEVCAVGFPDGDYGLDSAVNSAAKDDLTEDQGREMVLNLLALARDFGWEDGTPMDRYR